MTAGQAVNLVGSIAALAGSLAFVLVYTVFAPWWRNRIGRLLVVKALFMSAFMVVSITAYVLDSGNGDRLGPLLLTRGLLAAGYGLVMAYQAWIVSYTQMKAASRRAAGDA